MGQRTQILLKLEKDGKVKNYLYHLQWGFCKVMPAVLMNWTLKKTYFQESKYDKNYDFFKCNKINLQGVFNITSELTNKQKTQNIDISNLNELREILGNINNNNGFMVIELKQSGEKYMEKESCKIGFLLGIEEVKTYDEIFSKFVSPETYMKKSSGRGRYYDKNFTKSFMAFLKTFDIKIIK